MTSRLHKLAVLSAVLAAGILAPPALALPQSVGDSVPVPVRHYQDLRSPDARDAALRPHYYGQRGALPQPQRPQALTPSAARHTPPSGSAGSGIGTAPLAAILAAAALALAALATTARRRQARSVA